MRAIKKTALIAMAVIAVLLAMAGCSQMNDNRGDNTGTPQGMRQGDAEGRMLDNDVNDGRMRDNGVNDGRQGAGLSTARQKAMNIESELRKIPGIDDVEVVVSGDTAIVGCKSAENIDNLKRRIESQVKKLEPSIRNISVTNAGDLLIEIRNLANEIADGPSDDNLDPRVKQLIDKITPNR